MQRRAFRIIKCPICQQPIRRYSDGKYSAHYANNILCKPDFVYDPANTLEKLEQALVIEWARSHVKEYPCLEWLHSNLNGIPLTGRKANRNRIMNSMKTQGLVKGIFDLHLPYASQGYHGLYMDMKKLGSSKISSEQLKFKAYLTEQNYFAIFCYGHKSAIQTLLWYVS